MNEVLNAIMSILALISLGGIVLFLTILAENKEEVWEEIKDRYNIGE